MPRRKLIEAALPLDALGRAMTRERAVRHGHPRALHPRGGRVPLAAARAALFAQMVDDPSEYVGELLADADVLRAARRALGRLGGSPVACEPGAPASGDGPPGEAATPVRASEDGPVPAPTAGPALRRMVVALERERLLGLLEALVQWESTADEALLEQARAEIRRSWLRACAEDADPRARVHDECGPRTRSRLDPDTLPGLHDPFAGGGAVALEAQRLGLDACAGDVDPVAVLVAKATVEIPPRFAGRPPVHPGAGDGHALATVTWTGARGLAEDVRRYGAWMRAEAERRIGHLYPQVEVTPEMVRARPDLAPCEGRRLSVVAWLWARTVRSPHPAFTGVHVPLVSSFMLSTSTSREAYVEPVVEAGGYQLAVRAGRPGDAGAARAGTRRAPRGFRCLLSDWPIPYAYIDDEASAGRMRERLMAVVVAGDRTRLYLAPTPEAEAAARRATPAWRPDTPSRGLWTGDAQGRRYGLDTIGDYFTARQLVALTTFSDLVTEAVTRVRHDACGAGLPGDDRPLRDGGGGAAAYAEAVGVYLALALSRVAERGSTLCTWSPDRDGIRGTFAREGAAMTWGYAERNPLPRATGSLAGALRRVAGAIAGAAVTTACAQAHGRVVQRGAASFGAGVQADAVGRTLRTHRVVSTAPPCRAGDAERSDLSHVWLRRALGAVFPDLFAPPAGARTGAPAAAPGRHGDASEATAHFLDDMRRGLRRLAQQSHPAFPVTLHLALVPHARKGQADVERAGWEALLDAVIRSGFAITATWPVGAERGGRSPSTSRSTSASGVIVVCRPRLPGAPSATRTEVVTALRGAMPQALRLLQSSCMPPADLARAAVGPGLAVCTRYARVLGTGDRPLALREVLALIDQALHEALAVQEDALDSASRWALAWFERHGFEAGEHGEAETLAGATGTSMAAVMEAGLVHARGGQVRLLRSEALPSWWDPAIDEQPSVWTALHHLLRLLALGGPVAAAVAVAKLARADLARDLCYRLHGVCEHTHRGPEARAYAALVQAWPEIGRLARRVGK